MPNVKLSLTTVHKLWFRQWLQVPKGWIMIDPQQEEQEWMLLHKES